MPIDVESNGHRVSEPRNFTGVYMNKAYSAEANKVSDPRNFTGVYMGKLYKGKFLLIVLYIRITQKSRPFQIFFSIINGFALKKHLF